MTSSRRLFLEWLLEIIGLQIDWAQYRGQKGCSIMHLIIELITFIQYNLDLRSRQAVVLTCIDYHKAFNKQDHGNFLRLLHEMDVPGWLLNIIKGFLENRFMVMATKMASVRPRECLEGDQLGPHWVSLCLQSSSIRLETL